MSSKAQLILALALGVAQSCEFASFIISGGGCGGTAASLGIFETASLCAEAAYATPACAEGLATMPAYIEFDSVTGGCGCCDMLVCAEQPDYVVAQLPRQLELQVLRVR